MTPAKPLIHARQSSSVGHNGLPAIVTACTDVAQITRLSQFIIMILFCLVESDAESKQPSGTVIVT